MTKDNITQLFNDSITNLIPNIHKQPELNNQYAQWIDNNKPIYITYSIQQDDFYDNTINIITEIGITDPQNNYELIKSQTFQYPINLTTNNKQRTTTQLQKEINNAITSLQLKAKKQANIFKSQYEHIYKINNKTKQLNEKIKPYNNPKKEWFYNDNELYTIEQVIDTENLTEWLKQELNTLTPNLTWTILPEATYHGERDENGNSYKINNRLQYNIKDKPTNDEYKFMLDEQSFDVICGDSIIIITPNNWTFRPKEQRAFTWAYEDLNKQDAKEIAKYLAEIIKSDRKINPEQGKIDTMKWSKSYKKDFTELSEKTVERVKDCVEDLKAQLPRGKSRVVVQTSKPNNAISSVIVSYKPSSSSDKPQTICSFDVIDSGEVGDEVAVDLSCLTADGSKEVDSLVVIDSDIEASEIFKFVKKNLIEQFDVWYNKE